VADSGQGLRRNGSDGPGDGPVTRPPFPFSALVGQPDLTLALLLNAVSPAVGGVLVRGEKGTAKSTAVRGLAGLLPPIDVVAGCPYNCDPEAPDPACPAGPAQRPWSSCRSAPAPTASPAPWTSSARSPRAGAASSPACWPRPTGASSTWTR
jgi:hypothetical protein